MNKYRISVIIPVFNLEKYLHRCIESVLNQSFCGIEIIIVDDESTDNSGKIADEFVCKNDNVKVFHIKRGGVSNARNYGVQHSNGDYIAFLDGDDCVNKDIYEELYMAIISQKADIAFCDVIKVHENGIKEEIESLSLDGGIVPVDKYLKDGKYMQLAWNKLYKREIWDRFSFESKYFEDLLLVPEIISKSDRVVYVKKYLNYYFIRDKSISRTFSKENYMYKINAYKNVIDNVNKIYKDETVYWIVNNILDCIKRKELYFFREEFISFLQSISEEIIDNRYKADLIDSEIEGILYKNRE